MLRRCLLVSAVLAVLTFCKLLILDNNVGSVDLAALSVVIAARLDPAGNRDLCAFSEIFLSKFGVSGKSYARNKIGILSVVVPAP